MTHQWAETEDRPMMKETPLLDLGIGGHDHIPALYRYDEQNEEHAHTNPNEFTDDGNRNRWMVKVFIFMSLPCLPASIVILMECSFNHR
jgi:hypothetical protein